MKTLGTLALKVFGFFTFIYAVFRWGKAEAKVKQAEKRADAAIKSKRKSSEINSKPFVDNPFRRMLRKK